MAPPGHLEIVQKLLDEGVPVDVPNRAFNETSMMIAIDSGHTKVTRYLHQRGADMHYIKDFEELNCMARLQNQRDRPSTTPRIDTDVIDEILAASARIDQ